MRIKELLPPENLLALLRELHSTNRLPVSENSLIRERIAGLAGLPRGALDRSPPRPRYQQLRAVTDDFEREWRATRVQALATSIDKLLLTESAWVYSGKICR